MSSYTEYTPETTISQAIEGFLLKWRLRVGYTGPSSVTLTI